MNNIKCAECRKKKCIKCRYLGRLVLDPEGYFLIKTSNKNILVGFCSYRTNKIMKKISSIDPKKITEWAKINRLITRKDHFNYLNRELKNAYNCIKKNKKYIQL